MKRSLLILVSVLAVFLEGCSQLVGAGGPGGGPPPFSLTVTPATATVPGASTQQFAVKTSDGSNPAITWTVNGVAGGNSATGTISATGLYTAPEFPSAPNTIQYAATLASWFGVSAPNFPAIFPNLANFPTSNLGFMG